MKELYFGGKYLKVEKKPTKSFVRKKTSSSIIEDYGYNVSVLAGEEEKSSNKTQKAATAENNNAKGGKTLKMNKRVGSDTEVVIQPYSF